MKGRTLMIQGTASDVGKSLLTAALCRIFRQDGHAAAPFKSQNMALNSYVTPDGLEIGRAQGMQADACGIAATTDMNPILLKPTGDRSAQVVVHGKPLRDYDAVAYREQMLPLAEPIVKDALARLREKYDPVVIEGAGSPAEINLKDRDIVNMRLAAWADAPVVLVADIDRGGVFAFIVGTLELLTPEERDRVKGFVINKFRGDVSLLKPGLDWLEERTGKPVLGVVPYLRGLVLEEEDSASLEGKRSAPPVVPSAHSLDIAVIRLPRLSNVSDFDPLLAEPDVRVRYVASPAEWGSPDAVIFPGSKSTMEDLRFVRESGLEAKALSYASSGGHIVGICGGYQMLGVSLRDPGGVESGREQMEGIGLLPVDTVFAADKRTVRVAGTVEAEFVPGAKGLAVEGYEIHMGRTVCADSAERLFRLCAALAGEQEYWDGTCSKERKVWGTYLHDIFHNDGLRTVWLDELRREKGPAVPGSRSGPAMAAPSGGSGFEAVSNAVAVRFRELREREFDRLADHVRRHVDIARLYGIMDIQR